MVIETTYLEGDFEPFDETLRFYFAEKWNDADTNDITPIFLSPNGKDTDKSDLTKEISQADVNSLKASGLILFETTEDIPLESASNDYTTTESPVKITIYARSKYELALFIKQINTIIKENNPSSSLRIVKSHGVETSQDSGIAYFKETKGVKFSKGLLIDKEAHVYISTGFLTCIWIDTKTS